MVKAGKKKTSFRGVIQKIIRYSIVTLWLQRLTKLRMISLYNVSDINCYEQIQKGETDGLDDFLSITQKY